MRSSCNYYLNPLPEYPTKKSILKDVLSPEVYEFMALIEFESTYPANTIGAYVGRNFDESRVKEEKLDCRDILDITYL